MHCIKYTKQSTINLFNYFNGCHNYVRDAPIMGTNGVTTSGRRPRKHFLRERLRRGCNKISINVMEWSRSVPFV